MKCSEFVSGDTQATNGQVRRVYYSYEVKKIIFGPPDLGFKLTAWSFERVSSSTALAPQIRWNWILSPMLLVLHLFASQHPIRLTIRKR